MKQASVAVKMKQLRTFEVDVFFDVFRLDFLLLVSYEDLSAGVPLPAVPPHGILHLLICNGMGVGDMWVDNGQTQLEALGS